MLFSKPCRFVLFSAFLLTGFANAESVRGVQQRELDVAAAAPGSVLLGTAGGFAILAKTGITNVPGSSVTGNIAVSPIASTAITGFGLVSIDDGKAASSSQVTGIVYAASFIAPTPVGLTTAVSNMETAYVDAASRKTSSAANLNVGGGEIGSLTFTRDDAASTGAVVYTFGTNVLISNDVTINGDADDVFIIQTTGDLVVAAGKGVILSGGVQAKNIFWQVAGKVTANAGAHMEGIILVKTHATFLTGTTLNGRVLTQTACNLMSTIIVEV